MRLVAAAFACAALSLSGSWAADGSTAFDAAPWLDDFTFLRAAMERNYANLAWFASPQGGLDLPALAARTERTIREAPDAQSARRAILGFVADIGDGHFSSLAEEEEAKPMAEPAEFALTDAAPASACAALGFAVPGRMSFSLPFESLPGAVLENDGLNSAFRSALLTTAQGHKIALLRILAFRQAGSPALCEKTILAWRQQGKAITRKALIQDINRRWYETVAELLRHFAETGAEAVLVDIGNNGGGNDSGNDLARFFTDRPVTSARLMMTASPASEGYVKEELDEFAGQPPATERPAGREMFYHAQDFFRAMGERLKREECPMGWVWHERRDWDPAASCSHLVAAGFSSGPLGYLAPQSVSNEDLARKLYWPAEFDNWRGSWTRKVFVLTDGKSYSSAEMFAAVMQDNKVATLIGSRTGGDGCGFLDDPGPVTLPHSHLRFRMPNCVRLRADDSDEVAGVTPDIRVAPVKGESARARAARVIQAIDERL